jgi:hypothetical protein
MPNLTAKEAAEGLAQLPDNSGELKLCPFCGCSPEYCDIIDGLRYPYCVSPTCPMNLENPDEKDWNTRTPDPQVQVLQLALAEAEGALRQFKPDVQQALNIITKVKAK